ncbi:MAG: hypothetical protein ACI4NP_04850 [Thermoguttaceae bacterium]
MKRFAFVIASLSVAAFLPFGETVDSLWRAPCAFAQEQDDLDFTLANDEDETAEPLVLTVDDKDVQSADKKQNATVTDGVEELPQEAVFGNSSLLPPPAFRNSEVDLSVDVDEMNALSRQPLFKEFTAIIGENDPLPEGIDIAELDVPGAQLVMPALPATGPTQVDSNLEKLLQESLAVAAVKINSVLLTPEQRSSIEAMDAEIQRLAACWIDAEVNRNVSGRRERDWERADLERFSVAPTKFVDAPASDWALALDEPFWFQVFDPETNATFYTKAGNFEQVAADGSVALLRDGAVYALSIQVGRVMPSGRAKRVKVLKNGQIQGVEYDGKIVTDFNLGTIPLFVFANPSRLASHDGVLFTPTPLSGEPQRADLTPATKFGVAQHKLALSNGAPEKILERIVILCRSKAKFLELLGQSVPSPESNAHPVDSSAPNVSASDDADLILPE